MNPADPLKSGDSFIRRIAGGGFNLVEQALEAVSTVVNPLVSYGTGALTTLVPDTLMTLLTDAIAQRFTDRILTLDLAGRPVSGHLRRLSMTRRGPAFEAEFDFDGVTADGYAIHSVTVFARGVRLVPGVPTRLDAEQVDLIGEVGLDELLGWLNQQGLDWQLESDSAGLIVATHKLLDVTAVVDAEIREDLLRLETKAGRWRSVKLPTQLMPYRSIPLGPYRNNARIVRAVRDGHIVRFTVDWPAVRAKFNLRQVRDAILGGTGLRFW